MDTEQPKTTTPPAEEDRTKIRYLTPETCKIHVGTYGALHVSVVNDRIYGGVYAAYAFPVEHANEYISLMRSTGSGGPDEEVGVIRNLDIFPPDQVELVRQALKRRYFIHKILKIHDIHWDHGLVAMEVETDKGRVSFLMRWQQDRAVDYGRNGKVLLDVDENRYLIPDVEQLSASERNDFTRIIYW